LNFKAGPFNELVRVYTAQGKELRIDLHVRGSVLVDIPD